MKKSERKAVTAHHEAGHAVIARKLGVRVTFVAIFNDNSGHCTFARNGDLKTRISAVTNAMVSLAGPYAECRYRLPKGAQELAQARYCWRTDGENARDAVVDAECEELFTQLCDETWDLVDQHWPAIQRVAHGLLDCSGLDGADVDDLIAGKATEFMKAIEAAEAMIESEEPPPDSADGDVF